MPAWGNLTAEEWEEEQAWQESHPDSAGERLVEGLSDAMTISWPERGEREDYGDDGWGDSSVDAGGATGYSWVGWTALLAILTFPFSLYFVVGLFVVFFAIVGLGLWGLYFLAEQLTILLTSYL